MIVVPPRTVTVESGTDALFTCRSAGQPTPTNHFTHTHIISVTQNVTSDGGRILVSGKMSCDCHMTFINLISNACIRTYVLVNMVSCGSHLVECVM